MTLSRTLDVIIPVYNEALVLPDLCQQLDDVFTPSALAARGLQSVRYLFVDDGSTDDTAVDLAHRIQNGWGAVLLCLSRNFGHQAAIAAGLDHSTADMVAIIDADLQDPPALILDMVRRLDDGFDIVFGQRQNRKESFIKRVLYAGFYRLCSILSEVQFPVDAGDFCVMSREVVLVLRQLREKLRFNRGLRSWIGFRQSALLYDRPVRRAGTTKYSWSKLYLLATDGIASLSTRPIRFTQGLMFLTLLVTILYIGLTTVYFLRAGHVDGLKLWFLTTQGLIAFTSSLQLFSLYILGAYIGRTYLEVKARPSYVVMRTVAPSPTTTS